MRPDERKILEERLPNFVDDLIPVDLFPYLACLVEPDKDKIKCDSERIGEGRGTQTLIERLKKRGHEAFSQFVRALRETGSDHVAMLLDPLYKVEQHPDVEECYKESSELRIMGTAIDIEMTVHIKNADGNNMKDLEDLLANKFQVARSEVSREIRKKLAKNLPQGATFVHTKKGSVVTYFRLCKVDAADQLWEMSSGTQLKDLLTEAFLTDEIKSKYPDEEPCLEITFKKDYFPGARQKLEEIESGLLSRRTRGLAIEGCPTEVEDPDLQDDLPQFEIPPVHLDNGMGQQAIPLTLRGYQKELSQKALEGNNTIICSPTNSGKTYVALNIARNHLDQKMERGEQGKVLFVVSTVNLVLQQKERFQVYFLDKYKVKDISGSNACEIPLRHLVDGGDVVVLTAQILVNALKDGSLRLTSISLLVFDECHHTHKDHPYNKAMESYMTLCLQPGQREPLPQIVGLTASLGVGKAKNSSEAQDHILELCANMDAMEIATVVEHMEELKRHVSTPQRTVYPVVSDHRDVFDVVVNKAMEELETYVKRIPSVNTELPPTGRGTQQYRHWCETLYTLGVTQASRYLVTYAEQLRVYHISLTIKDATRTKDAHAYLRKYFEYLKVKLFTPVDRKLKAIYDLAMETIKEGVQKNGEPKNPKLEKLQELLLEYHKNDNDPKKDNAKGILFSKTRESTIALESWIKETDELSNELMPLRLVGSSDGEGGMTQKEQEEVIRKFSSGNECNIIIATTVAEEGLDISDCSYVIRYDMMGNEISSVQSRGRVRTKTGGKYSVVVSSTSGALLKEEQNLYRESLMMESLARVQKMDPDKRKSKIAALQKIAAKERSRKELMQRGLKSIFDPMDVTLKCRKCHVVACQAHDVRRIRECYHVAIADDFMELVIQSDIPADKVKKFDGFMFNKTMSCRKCGEHWGAIVNYKGLDMPCIKIQHFSVVMHKDGRLVTDTFKQWKKCPFDVEAMDFSELLELKMSLDL